MRLRLLAPALLLAGCAPARESWRDAVPQRPEVLVDVLPREAEVSVRGRPAGVGSRAVEVGAEPTPVRLAAVGFEAAELVLSQGQAGTRVGVALRPAGFGSGRALDLDEPAGLAAASGALLRQGRAAEAVQYAERAAELNPQLPAARRALGIALLGMPSTRRTRDRAIQELSAYLAGAGEASDRRQVERIVEELRGDISVAPLED